MSARERKARRHEVIETLWRIAERPSWAGTAGEKAVRYAIHFLQRAEHNENRDELHKCCCGTGSNTPTGRPYYCLRHMRWSDDTRDKGTGRYYYEQTGPDELGGIEWAKGYNDWRRKMRDAPLQTPPFRTSFDKLRDAGTPRFYHNPGLCADFVIDDIGASCSTWMVPGTYDAEADVPPPKVIATMFGYPFDVDRWQIQLGDQWYDAAVLRMFAQIMDDTKVVYDEKANTPHKWNDREIRMGRDGWRH